jgi:hypothetical protein
VKSVFILCALSALCVERAYAQEITAGIEAERARYEYHFTNPSPFDTPAPVPHFFEQHYIADNIWLVVSARYTAGLRWETEAGVTPHRTAQATDFDTFFDPDGTVSVSGTTGGASMQSFRIGQRGEIARAGPVSISAGYRLRVDTADFQAGLKTVTRNGVIITQNNVTSPETTMSQLHEALAAVRAARGVAPHWRLAIDGELAPIALGRLAVSLPEKYAGDVTFLAKAGVARAGLTLARTGVRWPVEISVDAGRTWSYDSSQSLTFTEIGARLTIGRAW